MIYRAVKNPTDLHWPARGTPRPPGNVAFFVDNIWEWLRPANMPSRRHSAFASPTPELALAAVNDPEAQAFRVEGMDDTRFCQITAGTQPEDAKYHQDCSTLKSLILKPLGANWLSAPLEVRLPLAPLFLPCASKDEIEAVMAGDNPWDASKIKMTCSFWNNVQLFEVRSGASSPHPTGEIFFDGSYRLAPL